MVRIQSSKTPKDREKRLKKLDAQNSQDSNQLFSDRVVKRKLVSMNSECLDLKRNPLSKPPNIQIVVNLPESGENVLGSADGTSRMTPKIRTYSQGDDSYQDENNCKLSRSCNNQSGESNQAEYEVEELQSTTQRRLANKPAAKSIQPSEALAQAQTRQSGQLSLYTFMKAPGNHSVMGDEGRAESCSGSQQKSGAFLGFPGVFLSPSALMTGTPKSSKVRLKSFRNLLKEVEEGHPRQIQVQRVSELLKSPQGLGESRRNLLPPSLQDLGVVEGSGERSVPQHQGVEPAAGSRDEHEDTGDMSPNTRRQRRLRSSGLVYFEAVHTGRKVHKLKRRREELPVNKRTECSEVRRQAEQVSKDSCSGLKTTLLPCVAAVIGAPTCTSLTNPATQARVGTASVLAPAREASSLRNGRKRSGGIVGQAIALMNQQSIKKDADKGSTLEMKLDCMESKHSDDGEDLKSLLSHD
jgi:hypothetical protein